MSEPFGYSVITPVRDEADTLPALAASLERQTLQPLQWTIVDTGSRDDTMAIADALAARLPFVRVLRAESDSALARGGPIARAFERGVDSLAAQPDVVVKVDADVTMDDDHFERVMAAFAADPGLGIASGTAYELMDGVWRQRHVSGGSVWGAARAYRWRCLLAVLPLEGRMGWDGIDQLKANMRGWRTRTLLDIPFRHHRREGERDGAPTRGWEARGRAAHYMGYRPSYLALRALNHMRFDRAAYAMVTGYVKATAQREPQCEGDVRAYLREQQRARHVPPRVREAFRRRRAGRPSEPLAVAPHAPTGSR